MKKRILFIVNPISGVGKQKTVEKLIRTNLDKHIYKHEIAYTKHAGHATDISREAATLFDVVVATGGDGTVNEVANGLVHSTCAMAVLPAGSGNGFARHLKIPMFLPMAMEVINKCSVVETDTMLINNRRFVNVAGIGFDAHVSHIFDKYGKRGFWSYFNIVVKELASYKPQTYNILLDEKPMSRQAFVIAFANASQFGNNASIAPHARIDDGMIDVCFLRPFPASATAALAVQLFTDNIVMSSYVDTFRAKHIELQLDGEVAAHIDGEPLILQAPITVKIEPLSLRVVANQDNIFELAMQPINRFNNDIKTGISKLKLNR